MSVVPRPLLPINLAALQQRSAKPAAKPLVLKRREPFYFGSFLMLGCMALVTAAMPSWATAAIWAAVVAGFMGKMNFLYEEA